MSFSTLTISSKANQNTDEAEYADYDLFYGGDDGEDSDSGENDDSNAENHFKNDYPDEDEFDNFKNETNSDDDIYG